MDSYPVVLQMGGGSSTTAGDCAIIALNDSKETTWVVDMHNSAEQYEMALKYYNRYIKSSIRNQDKTLKKPAQNKIFPGPVTIMITHTHKDHTGGKAVNNEGEMLRKAKMWSGSNVGTAIIPERWKEETELHHSHKKKGKKRQKVTQYEDYSYDNNDGSVTTIRVIFSSDANCPCGDCNAENAEENAWSTGYLLFRKQDEDIDYAMLSLGDMQPSEAGEAVIAALEGFAERKLDVIKLAHHGSASNLFNDLKPYIGPFTIFISSGWTGGVDGNKMEIFGTTISDALDNLEPKAVDDDDITDGEEEVEDETIASSSKANLNQKPQKKKKKTKAQDTTAKKGKSKPSKTKSVTQASVKFIFIADSLLPISNWNSNGFNSNIVQPLCRDDTRISVEQVHPGIIFNTGVSSSVRMGGVTIEDHEKTATEQGIASTFLTGETDIEAGNEEDDDDL